MPFRYRRATDLIPFSIDRSTCPSIIEITSQRECTGIINGLEDQLFTGAVKVLCPSRKSRSAALMWNGKVTGCVYGKETNPEPVPTEDSLKLLLRDCEVPGTQILKASLPEEIVLAMSALFLGYPVERTDSLNGPDYLQHIKNWLQVKELTAVIAISLPPDRTVLDFVHRGIPVGTFEVEFQRYSPAQNTRSLGDHLVRLHQANFVEGSVFAPDAVDKLGFRLTSRRTH